MSNPISEGGSDEGTAANQDGGQLPATEGGGQEESFDPKALFDSEVARLNEEESANQRKATDFNAVPENSATPDSTSDTSEGGAEEGGTEEEEKANEGDTPDEEEGSSEQEQEQEGEKKVEKKPRNDWKKQALEAEAERKKLEERLNQLEQKITEKPEEKEGDDKSTTAPPAELDTSEMGTELKELLEYTPGLDKLIASEAAKAAKALIEKTESDRAKTLQEAEQSQEANKKEESYWTDVDTWFSEQYPELSLSDVREDPDFTDWLEHRKNWVDAQLSGAERYDVSGAQKVFERYVTENNLAKPQEEPQRDNKRKLASARTPSVGKKSAPLPRDDKNLFQEEVEKLKANTALHRTI